MRILFLLHSYVSPDSVHGVGKFAHYLAKNLGHEIVVVDRHFGEGYSFKRNDYDGVVRYTAYSPDSDNMLLRDHQYNEDAIVDVLRNIFAKERPFDLVHIHHLISWPNSVIEYFHDLGLPVVLSVHDTWYICPALNYYNRFHDRICSAYLRERTHNNCSLCLQGLNEHRYDVTNPISWYEEHVLSGRKNLLNILEKTDAIVFPSQKMMDLYKKEGLLHKSAIKIPHFVDYPIAEPRSRTATTVFGYTGNISLGKGIEQLLFAFAYLQADIRLRIYGKALDEKLAETVNQYCQRDSRITYHGAYTDSSIFSDIDVVVVPSLWPESFNLCAYEAVQRGRHVLVSETAYHAEFLNEKNSTAFDPKNIGDLQKKIRLLHSTKELPTSRVNADSLTNKYTEIYSELVSMSGRLPVRAIYIVEKMDHIGNLQSAFLNADETTVLFNEEEVDLQTIWRSIDTTSHQKLIVQPIRKDPFKRTAKDTIIIRTHTPMNARDIAVAYKSSFATTSAKEMHVNASLSFVESEDALITFLRKDA